MNFFSRIMLQRETFINLNLNLIELTAEATTKKKKTVQLICNSF
jgi:hypothetical protein